MLRYTIKIDREVCVGDKACCEAAPDTFAMDADGKCQVADPQGDPPQTILTAAKGCRLEAISIFDAFTGKQLWPRRA